MATTKALPTPTGPTPGPWDRDPRPIRGWHASLSVPTSKGTRLMIAGIFDVDGYRGRDGQPVPDGSSEANARLIAAAPAMREALARAVAWFDESCERGCMDNALHNHLRAALALAEGKE